MSISQWPANSVELKPISSLIEYENNARTHSDDQVKQIAESMKEWGWTNPVLIDESNMIIAGHGRIMAAKSLGIDDAPVMVAKGWTEAQKKAYVLADNQLALNAGWDSSILSSELKELDAVDFDLSMIGFGELELVSFMATKTDGLTDPDDIPDAPETPVTKPGDVWVMGSHRLICGDSTDADTVSRVLNDVKPHLMVTDPPYGVEYDASWRSEVGLNSGGAFGKVENDERADWSEAWALFPGDVAYVWHADRKTKIVASSLETSGFTLRAQIIWAKSQLVIGRGDYHPKHEPCWYAVKKGKTGHWNGDRKQTTLWEIDKPRKSETGHSTQKPVECMRKPILNNSSAGQAVYEPFCGSGTTIIAGEMEGRCVYAIELSEAYCDVIVKRWQDFTGERAVLEDGGNSFEQVGLDRLS